MKKNKNSLNAMKSENAEIVDMMETTEAGIEAEIPNIERFDDKVFHEKMIDIEVYSDGNVKEQQEVLKVKLPVGHSEHELFDMEEKVKLFDVDTLPENEIFKTISDYLLFCYLICLNIVLMRFLKNTSVLRIFIGKSRLNCLYQKK